MALAPSLTPLSRREACRAVHCLAPPGDLADGTGIGHGGRVLEAAFWGFVGGAALLLGAVAGIYLRFSLRFLGLVMGFGAGVLISAAAFELRARRTTREAGTPVVLGMLGGCQSSSPAT